MSSHSSLALSGAHRLGPLGTPVLSQAIASVGEVALGLPGVKGGIIPLPPDKELQRLFACSSVKQNGVNLKLLLLIDHHGLWGWLRAIPTMWGLSRDTCITG